MKSTSTRGVSWNRLKRWKAIPPQLPPWYKTAMNTTEQWKHVSRMPESSVLKSWTPHWPWNLPWRPGRMHHQWLLAACSHDPGKHRKSEAIRHTIAEADWEHRAERANRRTVPNTNKQLWCEAAISHHSSSTYPACILSTAEQRKQQRHTSIPKAYSSLSRAHLNPGIYQLERCKSRIASSDWSRSAISDKNKWNGQGNEFLCQCNAIKWKDRNAPIFINQAS